MDADIRVVLQQVLTAQAAHESALRALLATHQDKGSIRDRMDQERLLVEAKALNQAAVPDQAIAAIAQHIALLQAAIDK